MKRFTFEVWVPERYAGKVLFFLTGLGLKLAAMGASLKLLGEGNFVPTTSLIASIDENPEAVQDTDSTPVAALPAPKDIDWQVRGQ